MQSPMQAAASADKKFYDKSLASKQNLLSHQIGPDMLPLTISLDAAGHLNGSPSQSGAQGYIETNHCPLHQPKGARKRVSRQENAQGCAAAQ